jgi:glutathione S-transferase
MAATGGPALFPEGHFAEVESWLEWEESVLRPAIFGAGPSLDSALQKLTRAVSSRQHLVGDSVTLADVAVYATLLPLAAGGKVWPAPLVHLANWHSFLPLHRLCRTLHCCKASQSPADGCDCIRNHIKILGFIGTCFLCQSGSELVRTSPRHLGCVN